MSSKIIQVFLYELKRNITKRGFLFTTFGLPLIGMALYLGVPALLGGDGDINPQTQLQEQLQFDIESIQQAGYVDQSGLFPEPGALAQGTMTRYDSIDAADAALDSGEIDVYYIVPADYAEEGDITTVLPRFSLGTLNTAPFQQLFYGQFADSVDQQRLALLVDPTFSVETIDVSQEAADTGNTEAATGTLVNLFAILLILALFGTNGYLMQSVIEEKQSRLIEILIASIRPVQLLVGKILALGLLGLLQLGVYILAVVIAINLAGGTDTGLAGAEIQPRLLAYAVVYFILGYLMFAALFGAVGALSTSISEGPSLATIFILPAMAPLFFTFLFVESPNGALPTFLSIFPLTAPMGMVMRASVTTVPIVQVALGIVLLIATIIGLMWLAGRLFRVQILLSGKVPGIRDIPKLVRG